MADIDLLDLGTAADDGTGDTLREGGQKINDNFTAINAELATALQATDLSTGTITPRNDDLNFSSGSDGHVWTVQADGSVAFEAPSAATVNVDQYDVVARIAAGNGAAGGLASGDLTEETAPASGDFLLGWESGGALRKFDIGDMGTLLGFGTTSGNVLVADGSAFASVAISGDVSLNSTGSVTIANDTVTNAKLANMVQATIKGRASGAGTGDPTDLTPAQAVAVISGVIDGGDVAVDTYGDHIDGTVQVSLEALDDAIGAAVSGELTQTSVATSSHEPVKANWYFYSTAGGVTVILGSDFEDSGSGLLEKVSGAGTINVVASSGFTINGSSRVSSSTNVEDAVWGTPSDQDVQVTSSGANLPDLDQGDVVAVRNHSTGENNAIAVVGSTHTTSALDLTYLESTPEAASSEEVDIDLLDPVVLVSRAFIARRSTNFILDGGTTEDKSFDGSDLDNIGDMSVDGDVVMDGAGEIYGQLSPWQTGTGSFASAASGRSWTVTGNITAIPVTNGWWGKFRNVSGSNKTLALASGNFVSMQDGTAGSTLTLGDDRACVVHCDGTNGMVDGVVSIA